MKKIGCFPLYPPLELFHSMGIMPVVLWGLRGTVKTLEKSDRHLQTYTCSVARHLMQYILSDKGKSFDGFFMYNACDTLRNLPEILSEGLKSASRQLPVLKMHIPMVSAGQTGNENYLKNEIASLVGNLEAFSDHSFSSEKFVQSIEKYNIMRRLAGELKSLSETGKIRFSEYSNIMKACNFLCVEEQIVKLESAIRNAGNNEEKSCGKRIIISGILPPPASVSRAIENAGMMVVGNDIAMLSRSYSDIHLPKEDPGTYYLDFYTHHYPCPTLLYSASKRFNMLLDMVKEKNADGVIFIGEKFCEYEYFEFPYLEKYLKNEGIETLVVEITVEDDEHTDAHRNRIEAFSEKDRIPV